jgi:hypothetical protein
MSPLFEPARRSPAPRMKILIGEDSDPCKTGRNFLEQTKPFAGNREDAPTEQHRKRQKELTRARRAVL